jgi:hypothetical protein
MEYLIELFWDKEADVWVATSNTLHLALESDSIEVLIERVKLAVPELLFLNKVTNHNSISLCFNIRFKLYE